MHVQQCSSACAMQAGIKLQCSTIETLLSFCIALEKMSMIDVVTLKYIILYTRYTLIKYIPYIPYNVAA
jgi:hypothetical protein